MNSTVFQNGTAISSVNALNCLSTLIVITVLLYINSIKAQLIIFQSQRMMNSFTS
jgi:hypothetical protein